MSLFTLLLIILIVVGLYYGMKYLALQVLSAFVKVEEQKGILSYGKITFSSEDFDVELKDVDVMINPFSVFSSDSKLLDFSAESTSFKLKSFDFLEKKDEKEVKEDHKEDSPVYDTFLLTAMHTFIHKIIVRLEKITVQILPIKLKVSISGLLLKYLQEKGSRIELKHSEIQIDYEKLGHLDISPAKYSISFAELSLLKLMNQANTIIALNISMKDFNINTVERILTISPFTVETKTLPGSINLSGSELKITLPKAFPMLKVSFEEFCGDLTYPLYPVQHATIDQLQLEVKGFKVSSITDKLFAIDRISIKKSDIFSGSPIISVDAAELNYSSTDGLEVFQLIPMLRDNSKGPEKTVFNFPELQGSVKDIDINLHLTDACVLSAHSSDAVYENKVFKFQPITGKINNVESIYVDDLELFSKDSSFLDIKGKSFRVDNHKGINFADIIDNATYAWRLVKKYVSRNIFDSETLPFPMRFIVDEFLLTVDDDLINYSLQQVVSRTGDVLKESVVLKYILNLKMDQCHLNEKQSILVKERLRDLIFHNYKDAVGEIQETKKASIQITDIFVEMDSTDFVGKVALLQEYDPTIKEFYQDVEWETLEGFKLDAKMSSAKMFALDIKDPLMSAEHISLNGPLIFAEVMCKKEVTVPFKVNDKEFTVTKSAADVKIYSDFKANFSLLNVAYGPSLLKAYDEFSDAMGALAPDGVDPSPPLRWWDKMRSMFRGKYQLIADRIIGDFLGADDPHDFQDKATVVFDNPVLTFTEGVVSMETSKMKCTRCENGPVIMHFPGFSVVATFIWATPCGEQRKHLVIPDVDKFNDAEYDTYEQFRSSGFDIDLLFNYKPDDFAPFISLDFAHLEWLIKPIFLLFDYPLIFESYKKKYGMKQKKQAKYMHLSDLQRIITYRFKVPLLSFRIFDHFPALETTNINGTSIDCSLINPDLSFRTELMPDAPTAYDVGLKAESIQLNATDLADYAKTTTINSSTIATIKDLDFCYGKVSRVSVSGIDIYLNQVFSMYLNEFVRSIIHIINKKNEAERKKHASQASQQAADQEEYSSSESTSMSSSTTQNKNSDLLEHLVHRNTNQRIASIYNNDSDSFTKKTHIDNIEHVTTEVFSAVIPMIRIVVESMNYEVSLLAVISGADIAFRTNTETKLTAITANLKTASIYTNCDFNTPENDLPEIAASIDEIKLHQYSKDIGKEYKDNCMDIVITLIKCSISTNQIAMIKQIFSEVSPETPKEAKQLELAAEDYFQLKTSVEVLHCMFDFKDQFLVDTAFVALDKTVFNIDMKLNGNTETTASFSELSINDQRLGAEFGGIVVMKSSSSMSHAPHLRIQLRTTPPVGGINVFNHIEMNLDPTIINYDAKFFEVIQALFTSPILAPKCKAATKYIVTSVVVSLPPVLVPSNILPQIGESYTDFLLSFKSSEINVMFERAETNFMMRYFKVTNSNLCVSYRNEDNNIISEINAFKGVLHDIIYQDLTTSFGGLVDKIIGTVAKDMIPQFLKHLVGLGKLSSSKETELQKWLNSESTDKTKVMAKKKQLIFGRK